MSSQEKDFKRIDSKNLHKFFSFLIVTVILAALVIATLNIYIKSKRYQLIMLKCSDW